jgi:D-glycerate 3-kinase
MQQFSICFNKVKKDCFEFIKSQETKTDKFKNKERMIKSFLIPLCFWISKKAEKKKTLFCRFGRWSRNGQNDNKFFNKNNLD